MKNIQIFCVLMMLLVPMAVYSQQQTAPQMTEEQKKMMEAWMKIATPGEKHKQLMALEGSYSIATKTRMDSKSPFVDSTGTCDKKAVLSGRYVSEHCNSQGMMGMPPFEGMGLLGYNNYSKQYELFWFDNMSTMGYVMKGTADASGKVITLKGSYEDPMSKKSKNTRWVLTIQDNNKHKLELYDQDSSGKEYLGADIQYTRK